MKFKKYTLIYFLLHLFLMNIPCSKAQVSMLQDVSYLYLEKLVATAKANYPRLKALTSEIEVAKKDLNATRTSWLDPFSFQYVTRSNQPNTGLVDVTTADILTGYQFGISVNPGTLLSKPSLIKKAKEQVNIAKFNKEEYNLTLEAEVKKRYFIFLQYKNSLSAVNRMYLDAESNFNLAKISYQKAEIKLLEYNELSIAYNQAYQNKLQLEASYMQAKAALEELTVDKLEQIK